MFIARSSTYALVALLAAAPAFTQQTSYGINAIQSRPQGDMIVAFGVTALQIAVLIGAARARGIHFAVDGAGIAWFLAAGALFTIGMYGAAEALAARVPRAEEYISRVPAIAIVPWFLAGSLFPVTALPEALTWVARFLPLTHALALVRYGLLDDPSGLHNIWRMDSAGAMAALSLAVVAAFAALLAAAGIRLFSRTAVS